MSKNKSAFLLRKEYSREKSTNDTVLVELKVYFVGLPVYYEKKSVPARPFHVPAQPLAVFENERKDLRTRKRVPTVRIEIF